MMSPAFPDWRGLVLWGSYDRRQRSPLIRCAGNIIVARPVEAKGAETAHFSELEAA
jgi:hypothetical protein